MLLNPKHHTGNPKHTRSGSAAQSPLFRNTTAQGPVPGGANTHLFPPGIDRSGSQVLFRISSHRIVNVYFDGLGRVHRKNVQVREGQTTEVEAPWIPAERR